MNPDGGNSNYNSFGLKNALSFGTPISLFQKETGWHQDEESNIVHHPDLEDAQLQTQNKIPQQLWQGRFQIRTLNRCDQWCFAISCKNTYLAVETY